MSRQQALLSQHAFQHLCRIRDVRNPWLSLMCTGGVTYETIAGGDQSRCHLTYDLGQRRNRMGRASSTFLAGGTKVEVRPVGVAHSAAPYRLGFSAILFRS
jgi:hypothetical protein